MADATKASKEIDIPVSLGKPSLRRRLEAYYSLINPESIQDQDKWLQTFQQIYSKYGGSYEGERKLAAKLAKKYGTKVRLLLAESVLEKNRREQNAAPNNAQEAREESWFALRPEEQGSGVVDFCSTKFDPRAALMAPQEAITKTNPWVAQCSVMNHVDQCRSILPSNDPLYKPAFQKNPAAAKKKAPPSQTAKPRKLGPFAAIAEHHQKGPLSLLHKMFEKRQRVRVLIRYVDSIRGTLTGYLVAYDKHCNMILRDVDEVYSPRRSRNDEGEEQSTNLEAETKRRILALQQTQLHGNQKSSNNNDGTWQIRQRHMKQMLVRGDNVVMVYRAESEKSAWPKTAKSPTKSVHGRKPKTVPEEERVGSPGSLIYALQQQSRRRSSQRGSGQRYDYRSSH